MRDAMLTTYGPPAPSVDPETVGVAFAHGVRDGWLYLPGGVHWLLVGWVVAMLLVRVAESDAGSRVRLWLLNEAGRLYLRHRRWWTTDPEDTSRVLLSDLRADSERADMTAREDARILGFQADTLTVATEPVSLVEPDVRVCVECGAPVDLVDELVRGLFEPEGAEPGLTGWKPGMPPWGTPPWQGQESDAKARLFRQMISDALRRHEAASEQK